MLSGEIQLAGTVGEGVARQQLDDFANAVGRAQVAPAARGHAQHAQIGGAAFEQIA